MVTDADAASQKFYRLLGLGRRAGQLTAGSDAVMRMLETDQGGLLILAGDASQRTRARFTREALHAKTPLLVLGTMVELGQAAGMTPRAILALAKGTLADEVRLAGLAMGGILHE